MDYQITHDPEQNRFETMQNGLTAYVEYERFENCMDFVHTIVPMPLEGKGIATALVRYAVDFAEKNGFKIIPTCPFVEVYLRRHPEYNSMRYIK